MSSHRQGRRIFINRVTEFCKAAGIQRHLSAPYFPQQNGVVERKNRTTVEIARSLLGEGGLPNTYWGEAVSTAVHLLNKSPTKDEFNKTPLEAWSNQKPSVSYLKVFGCIAYPMIPSQQHKKLDSKSVK